MATRLPMHSVPCARNMTEFHSRRISSCSSGSASSSSYASSEDNVFVHRHMDNNNIPKHIDRGYYAGSHDNKAYRHEEATRPLSVDSNETELVELETNSSHIREVSHRLRASSCLNCVEGREQSATVSQNGPRYHAGGTNGNLLSSCSNHKDNSTRRTGVNMPDLLHTQNSQV